MRWWRSNLVSQPGEHASFGTYGSPDLHTQRSQPANNFVPFAGRQSPFPC